MFLQLSHVRGFSHGAMMIGWGENGFERHMQLCRDLAWLEKEHPEKTALIGVARAHVETIRMAGSCESFSAGPKGVTCSNS